MNQGRTYVRAQPVSDAILAVHTKPQSAPKTGIQIGRPVSTKIGPLLAKRRPGVIGRYGGTAYASPGNTGLTVHLQTQAGHRKSGESGVEATR